MAITTVWSISDMEHKDSDGGVFLVRWSCVAYSSVETDGFGNTQYGGLSAREAGKLHCDPDPTASDFIPYADLTEATVLGWVYNSLIEGEETADEAKARVEANRTAKVQAQIDEAAANSSGVPW